MLFVYKMKIIVINERRSVVSPTVLKNNNYYHYLYNIWNVLRIIITYYNTRGSSSRTVSAYYMYIISTQHGHRMCFKLISPLRPAPHPTPWLWFYLFLPPPLPSSPRHSRSRCSENRTFSL